MERGQMLYNLSKTDFRSRFL